MTNFEAMDVSQFAALIERWEDLTDDEIPDAVKAIASETVDQAIEFGAAQATKTYEIDHRDATLSVAKVGERWVAVWITSTPDGPEITWAAEP